MTSKRKILKLGAMIAALVLAALAGRWAARLHAQGENITITGQPQYLANRTGIYIGSILDDATLNQPPSPKVDDIDYFVICSSQGTHYLAWPSNFVDSPQTMLRKGTCVSASYVYDIGTTDWYPLAPMMIYYFPSEP